LKQRRIYLKLRPVAGPTPLALAALLLATAPVTDAAVRTEVDRLVGQVTAARRLPFRGTLQARAVTRDAAEAQIAAAVAARITTSNFGVEEQILKRLGLIADTADYAKLWAAGAAGAPVAVYDPTAQRLLVPDFLSLDDQRVALLHEIAHAVADQRFDLRQFLTPPPPSPLEGDATRARLALVEGDATLAAMEVMDPGGAFLGPAALASLVDRLRAAAGDGRPPWLAALGRFVHVDGFLFVAEVRARHPWTAVDALWRDPPASSEQVLHREKYEACEGPVPVPEAALPVLPGFDRPKASDVLGELAIRAWLSTVLPAEVAARAAAGWAGDRAAIYPAPLPRPDAGAPPQPPLAWLTIWDDGAEAEDFARAAAAIPGTDALRRGEAVALLVGAPELAPAALAAMLDAWKSAATVKSGKGGRPRRAAPPGCPRRDRAAAPR
jgi:hypothetical protein